MRAYALLAYFSADTDHAGRMTEIDNGDGFQKAVRSADRDGPGLRRPLTAPGARQAQRPKASYVTHTWSARPAGQASRSTRELHRRLR
jgi:hypothetical protein